MTLKYAPFLPLGASAMPGPERPTLYDSSTPASRASAAREQAPCSRLSWSGGLWGNSKTTCGNCGKGRNPPATIHVLDSSTISIISRRALRRPACAARRGGNRHDPMQKLYSRKVCIFSVSRLGGTPNAQHRHRLRKLREFAPWLAGRMEDRFHGPFYLW